MLFCQNEALSLAVSRSDLFLDQFNSSHSLTLRMYATLDLLCGINSLPDYLQTTTNTKSFKRQLKKHLFTKVF